MKRILAMVMAVIMIFSVQLPVHAAEVELVPGSAFVDGAHIGFETPDAILIGSDVQTRSTDLPTASFSLAADDYDADLQIVGKNWLYTNKYFRPNGDGRIYVSYDVTADNTTTYLYIGLYDLTKDELVVEHTAIEVRTTGKTGVMYFYNLTISHNYAVCFRAHPDSLNGSATIYH